MLRYLLAVNPLLEAHRGGGQNNPPAGPTVESVIFSQPQLTLVVNDTFSLNALVLPTGVDASVLWKSSDESVVTIDKNGRITAEGVGTAVITATAKADTSKKAVCKVTVVTQEEGIQATSITLSPTKLDLVVGETKLLSVTVSPDNAVMPELTWSSNNDAVVKVDNGNIIGIREGSAMVTVSTVTGGLTDSCQVTVSPRTGIEGKWLSNNGSYVITANTITTGYDGMNGFVPRNLYKYTKSGNETKGTITVTRQAQWDSETSEWVTVGTEIENLEAGIQEQKKMLDGANLGELKDMLHQASLEDLKLFLRELAAEMNMTFNENNLTKENLTKPVPQDVKELLMSYAGKMVTEQKEEMTRPRTYGYEVTDDPWNGPMIQLTGMYDTTKNWFEQTDGEFSTNDNGISISYDPQSKNLYGWDPTEINISFSSVTETELTDENSGKWTANWNESTLTLTLTSPSMVTYTLEWSSPLY